MSGISGGVSEVQERETRNGQKRGRRCPTCRQALKYEGASCVHCGKQVKATANCRKPRRGRKPSMDGVLSFRA